MVTLCFLEESELGRDLPGRWAILSREELQIPQYTANSTRPRQNLRITPNPRLILLILGHWENMKVMVTQVTCPWRQFQHPELDSSRPRRKILRIQRRLGQSLFWEAGKQCYPQRSAVRRAALKIHGEEEQKWSYAPGHWVEVRPMQMTLQEEGTKAENMIEQFTSTKGWRPPTSSPEQHMQNQVFQPPLWIQRIHECPVGGTYRNRPTTPKRVSRTTGCLWPSSGILTWRAPIVLPHQSASGMNCRWYWLNSFMRWCSLTHFKWLSINKHDCTR